MLCPCGSEKEFQDCCEPYLEGKTLAPTAEATMRARYTAHVVGKISYIRETLAPETRSDFDEVSVRKWATQSEWLGLKIIASSEKARRGTVEFVATYKGEGKVLEHHETATFRRDEKTGEWFFLDGDAKIQEGSEGQDHTPIAQIVREGPKVGRNDPCPCGSGKKYKKCCGK